MTMFRGSVHIYGTMDDAVRLVASYAKHMALETGGEPAYFSVKEDWFDSFKLVAQWLEYNEDLTTDDLPERRKVLEISCFFDSLKTAEPDRFIENTIDAALAEFYQHGGRPNLGDPDSIPWASSSDELDEEGVERFGKQFPGVIA
ncbi:hypothetical protein NONI108955_14080 [Nocardia ninae]|uniref:Uncharacterized protein n=1 Tax=Nocardia ninae NBRC 108245 TaxID=1210091 RepID=A0A511M7A4_9NOCA|nr:hypothetical protein [Nocardia ninae]GEM35576.1 hypothetical protein NN4_00950 [Nocardia ninae NBRC 108245]